MNRDEAKAKIAKLMALGTHESTNENEAERALRQAAFLMKQHAIEEAELADARGAAQVFEWASVNIPLDPKNPVKSAVGWLGTLAVGIAKFTDTKADYVLLHPWGMCARFQGEAIDVEYAGYLMKHLRDTIRRMSADYKLASTRSDREEYRRGMVGRLTQRMERHKREMNESLRQHATVEGTALVVLDRKIAERDARFGAPKYRTRTVNSNANGAFHQASGSNDANNVGFGRPLAGPAGRRALPGAA